MYDNPRRRGGQGVVGARVRPVPAGAHVGTAAEFLPRHEVEAATSVVGSTARPELIAELDQHSAGRRSLICAGCHLAAGAGQAAGIDGMPYDDVDKHEVW